MAKNRSMWSNLPVSDRLVLSVGVWLHESLQRAHSLSMNVPGILIASALLGMLTALQYRRQFTFASMMSLGVKEGILVIGLPYIIGIVTSLILNRKRLVPRHLGRRDVVFTAAIAFWAFTLTMVAGYVFAKLTPLAANDVLILSGSASFALAFVSFLILTEDFFTSLTLALPLTIPMLLVSYLLESPLFPMPTLGNFMAQFALIYSVVLAALSVVVFTTDNIFKSELGVSGVQLLNIMLSFLSGSKKEMESALESIGQKANTFVGLILFRGNKDVLWVVPGVHPGPFASIGGAGLPRKLQEAFPDLDVFCFHGPSNHELDPVSEKEIDKLVDFIAQGLNQIKLSRNASVMEKLVGDKVMVAKQVFGERPVYVAYKYIGTSEDIAASVGGAVAMREGTPILIDGHNRLEERVMQDFWHTELRSSKGMYLEESINFGDDASFDIIDTIVKAEGKKTTKGVISLGTGAVRLATPETGIGAMGVKVTVVKVDKQKTAYVLIDGNNMIDGLRETIETALKHHVNEVVVATTDNHDVNSLTSDLNPVGEKIDHAKLTEACKTATLAAINSMERVKVGTYMGVMRDMEFLGPGKPEQILSASRAFISLSKVMLPGTVLALLTLGFMSMVAI